jgi:ribosome-associated protein
MAADPISVTDTVRVPGEAIRFKAVRAGGAGGQNVNKVSSKVELRIDMTAIEGLPEDALLRLRAAQRNRLDAEGLWIVISDRTRDQLKNLEDARAKAAEAIRSALVRPIPRRATRPTRASKERRLESKKRIAQTKQQRRGRFE